MKVVDTSVFLDELFRFDQKRHGKARILFLGVPCVTLRENTERPETVDVGANMLARTGSQRILDCASKMIETREVWKNPFGEGNTGQRIIKILGN